MTSSLVEMKTKDSEILCVCRALSDRRNKHGLVPALTELALWLERQQSAVWNTWVYAVLLCGGVLSCDLLYRLLLF